MEDHLGQLKEKMDRALKEAAKAAVELDRTDGTISDVPHYSVIEARAHELGRRLSREVQQRQMNETVALQIPKAACPTCGTRCELVPKQRAVTSIDGRVDLQELEGRCPFCRRAFFPSAGADGV